MINDSIPTPESLYFSSPECSKEVTGQSEQLEAVLLEQEVQKQLNVISDGNQVLEEITRALESWNPSVKTVEVEIHKGLLFYSHHCVTDTMKDRGWEIQEPYQDLGGTRLLLKIYPNSESRKVGSVARSYRGENAPIISPLITQQFRRFGG